MHFTKISLSLLYVLLFFSCKKEQDKCNCNSSGEETKGNFIGKETFKIASAKAYSNQDTLLLLLQTQGGEMIRFNLYETSAPNSYMLGKGSKNEMRFLKDSAGTVFSTLDMNQESYFRIESWDKNDSSVTIKMDAMLGNTANPSEIIRITMNADNTAISYTSGMALHANLWDCNSGDFGSLYYKDQKSITLSDTMIKMYFKISGKENMYAYIPTQITSGTYNFNMGRSKAGALEPESIFMGDASSIAGEYKISHDKINRVIIFSCQGFKAKSKKDGNEVNYNFFNFEASY